MTLGEKICYQRNLHGMRTVELAARMGVAPDVIQRWENNQESPTPEQLNALCSIFGVPPAAFSETMANGSAPSPQGVPPYGYAPPFYAPIAPVHPKQRVWKGIALALFICSIMSIFIGVLIGEAVSSTGSAVAVLIAFLAVAIVPVASVVVGVIMNAKGIPNVKNIIAGALAACILFLFGIASFGAALDRGNARPELLFEIETMLELDLPEPDSVDEYDYMDGYDGVNLSVWFSDDEADALRTLVTTDTRFLAECPTVLVGAFPEATAGYYARYLLYSVDGDCFNKLPTKRGLYDYVCICYDADYDMLEIYRYTLEFIPYGG